MFSTLRRPLRRSLRQTPPCHSYTSSRALTEGCLRLYFTAFQGNLDFCPYTDKTLGNVNFCPSTNFEWLSRGLQNSSEHARSRAFNTGFKQHVWTVSVQLKEYSQQCDRVSYHSLHSFFPLQKTRVLWLSVGEGMAILALFVLIQYQRVTNRRTDVRHSCCKPIYFQGNLYFTIYHYTSA